jgi:hypothetical protein
MEENLYQLPDRRLISQKHKEHKKLKTKRTNNPINKWADELETVLKSSINGQ